MKEKRPWRLWCTFLALLIGYLDVPVVLCQQSYDEGGPAKGDVEEAAAQGFSGVVARHDGYVKGETPTIPQTSFSCSNQPHNPGLYADMETQCQVYHVCFEDRQESFLCGPGTNFNQRILACDFWYNFNCQESATFYGANADIGKVPDTVYKPNIDQPRQPQPRPQPQPQPQPQRPTFPTYPQPDTRPPSGSYQPPRVSVAPPPRPQPQPQPRPQPQPPRIQPQPQPQPPRIPPPRIQPEPPRIQPPSFQPQPQPPSFQPQPQPPSFQPQPQPPRFQPQPPSFQPQPRPPSFQPQPQPPRIHPQPPPFEPESQYPRIPQGSGQPPEVRPPPSRPLPPSFQQEEDDAYHFDGSYKPQRPVQIQPQQPRPVFPPVVSPPRVSRPPLTPPVVRQPSGSISRPRVPVSRPNIPEYDHPDANIKGQTDYNRPPQQPRIPEPSRPVGIGYPSYPGPRPTTQKPVRPYQPPPPPPIQQEHIDNDYVPPPPPPPPQKPSKPIFVPPPPPPVRQERPPPSRPTYVPPQEPVDVDYRPQPPVSPSVIREQQKPAIHDQNRPQTSVSSRQPQPPQRPRPVFPPSIDHPNANIKGGPGYQQPPPPPRFEPTRISRPSTSQSGYLTPPDAPVTSGRFQPEVKQPSHSGSTGYKPPPPQPIRVKKPSEPFGSIYQPPISPIIDHPRSEIKGSDYEPPVIHQQPPRITSPSTSTGVKRPQRPRAPVVVSRPVKKPIEPIYEKPEPQAPATSIGRVKLPSQTQTTIREQPRFPSGGQHIDHPDANIKGGGGNFGRRPQPQNTRVTHISRPSSPSTSYEQKTPSTHQGQGTGSGYPSQQPYPPKGDDDYYQQEVDYQQAFKPQRRPQTNTISSAHKVQDVKDDHRRPPSSSQHIVVIKPSRNDYDAGSSYTRGPDVYPKPEFGQSNQPYKPPVSTPSRSSQIAKERQSSSSQNSILPQTKPVYQGSGSQSGTGTQVRPNLPAREVPGYQPPYQRQVFPHRENPDHPNESLKGSGAYRPPPPAGFQGSASEVQEQQVDPEPEPAASTALLGDIGAE